MSLREKLFYDRIPPKKAADGPTFQVMQATTGAAASLDWAGTLSSDKPKGKVWIAVQALGAVAYVRFGASSTTATDASSGWCIPQNTTEYYYVDPVNERYIDHFSTGAGTLKVRVCSPIGERRDV